MRSYFYDTTKKLRESLREKTPKRRRLTAFSSFGKLTVYLTGSLQ